MFVIGDDAEIVGDGLAEFLPHAQEGFVVVRVGRRGAPLQVEVEAVMRYVPLLPIERVQKRASAAWEAVICPLRTKFVHICTDAIRHFSKSRYQPRTVLASWYRTFATYDDEWPSSRRRSALETVKVLPRASIETMAGFFDKSGW